MRLARVLCFSVVTSALPAGLAHAQDPIIDRRSGSPIPIDAGAQVTAIFRSVNASGQRIAAASRFELPAGWKLVVGDTISSLAAGESHVSFFVVSVPSSIPPGTYPLRFSFPGRRAADSVVVVVGELRRIEVTALSSPRFVAAGEAYDARFVVRNAGNARATIQLSPRAADGSRTRSDSASVHLEPGASRTVRVNVQTVENIPRMVAQAVQLNAAIAGDTSANATGAAAVVVQVIPVHVASPERFRSLPAQFTLMGNGTANMPTPELAGSGFLNPNGGTRIDFLLRGPQGPGNFAGGPDEYWIGFSAANRYRVRIGDAYSRGARLTETGRPTFGTEGDLFLRRGSLVLNGYANRDRRSWDISHEQAIGGGVDYRPIRMLALGTGFLHRSGIDNADILTARGALTPSALANLRWEVGLSSGAVGSGLAEIVVLTGVMANGRVGYAARHERADSSFNGIWRGSQYDDGTLSLRLPTGASLFGTITRSTRSQRQTPGLPQLEEKTAETGLDFRSFVNVSYLRRNENGILNFAVPSRVHDAVRVQSNVPVGAFVAHGEIERGLTRYSGSSGSLPFLRAAGQLSASLGQQGFSLGFNRFTGTPSYTLESNSETSFIGGGSFHLTGATRLNVIATGTRRGGAFAQTFSMVDVGLSQDLPRGHRSQIRARSSASGTSVLGFENRDIRQQLSYTVPLNVPTGVPTSGANVELRILDAASNKPFAGVLVRLANEARFTDANGRATFTALDAGTYYLEADREKLGAGHVISPILPLAVTVSGNETEHVELRVTPSARLTGRVRLMDFAQGRPFGAADSLVDAGPYPGLILSLVDGDTLRVVVDGFGRFAFDNLHPGPWILRVVGGVQQNYRLDQTEVTLDLVGGDAREVELRAVPTRVAPRFQPTEVVPSVGVSSSAIREPVRPSPTVTPPPSATLPARRPAPTLPTAPSARRPGPTLPPPPPLPTAGPGWKPPAVTHHYTVTKHDVGMMAIARAVYGDPSLWPKIWLANLDKLKDPGLLHAGDRLRVPDKAPLTREEIAARDAYNRRRRP